jgi:hypothetical protein
MTEQPMSNLDARLKKLERTAGIGAARWYVVEVLHGDLDKNASADRALMEAGISAGDSDIVILLDHYDSGRGALLVNQWKA